jgi:hypothetical protein
MRTIWSDARNGVLRDPVLTCFRDESTSVFRVPLACEAVPQIGCGVRAKPVLQALERDPAVHQVRLHHEGRLLVVAWAGKDADAAARRRVLSTLRSRGLKVVALRGAARANALSDLAANSSTWFRSAGVDRLTKQEARVIAARMLTRLRARAWLANSAAKSLEKTIAAACEHELILRPTQSAPARKQRIARAILHAARRRVDDAAFNALALAVRLGHWPLPAER